MILNQVMLPLTHNTTIHDFIVSIGRVQNILNIPEQLAIQLMNTYVYFLQYLIQLMFLSVGFWLLDLPHLVFMSCKRCFNKN